MARTGIRRGDRAVNRPADGVSAYAGEVIESIFVRTAVVVDDRLAEMKAVVERCARDGAGSRVNRLDARVALECAAGALHVRVKLAIERVVDFLRLIQSSVWRVLCVFNACAGLLEHVSDAGSRPGTHAEKDGVDVSEAIEAKDRGIDPAVYGDVGRTEC